MRDGSSNDLPRFHNTGDHQTFSAQHAHPCKAVLWKHKLNVKDQPRKNKQKKRSSIFSCPVYVASGPFETRYRGQDRKVKGRGCTTPVESFRFRKQVSGEQEQYIGNARPRPPLGGFAQFLTFPPVSCFWHGLRVLKQKLRASATACCVDRLQRVSEKLLHPSSSTSFPYYIFFLLFVPPASPARLRDNFLWGEWAEIIVTPSSWVALLYICNPRIFVMAGYVSPMPFSRP